MPYYTNATKAVINIGGHTVIAPTKTAKVDPEIRGVQDLIKRGLLVEAEGPEGDRPSRKKGGKAAEGEGDVGGKEPATVAELKAWLDEQGAQYDATANKAELQGLYEALKAGAGQ
ncbi:hypothetical protein [Achromobacter insolitus]|uniref:hypothetical protein n=1 Tax=Achromobacter insolitus TaxID=217204 RepID=UPI0027DFF7DA|nr:hypothetical protein [Achromobacter insolitus]MDQ6212360.1 hypothetical protein [Achromobacter insolitus]